MGEGGNTRDAELKGLSLGTVSQAEQIGGMLHLSWQAPAGSQERPPPPGPETYARHVFLHLLKLITTKSKNSFQKGFHPFQEGDHSGLNAQGVKEDVR